MSARQRRRRQDRRTRHSLTGGGRAAITATGLTAGATLAMSGLAHAAPQTFTVGSLYDATGAFDCSTPTNTECTLRQAIIDANGNDGADTIVFRSGLSGDINLTDGAPEQIQEALAIAGPGAAQITVDGGDAVRTFDIDPTTA